MRRYESEESTLAKLALPQPCAARTSAPYRRRKSSNIVGGKRTPARSAATIHVAHSERLVRRQRSEFVRQPNALKENCAMRSRFSHSSPRLSLALLGFCDRPSSHPEQTPNKAPEPTTTAAMPRAIADSFSLVRPAGARVTPAVVVAHL